MPRSGFSFRSMPGRTALTLFGAGIPLVGGIVREIVLADQFGISTELDVFLVATSVPLALVAIFASIFQTAAVPTVAESLQDSRIGSGRHFYAIASSYGALMATAVALWIVATRILPEGWMSAGLRPPNSLSAALLILTVVTGVGVAALSSHALALGLAPWATFAPSAVPIAIAGVVLVSAGNQSTSLFVGLFVGYLLLAMLLAGRIVSTRQGSLGLRIDRQLRHRLWRRGVTLIPGTLIMAMTAPVDLYVAGTLYPGAPSAISFGSKVPLAAVGIGGLVISNLVFPTMARQHARGDERLYRATIRSWIGISSVAGGLAAVVALLTSEVVTSALYGHGSIDSQSLQEIASIHRMFSLAIPPFWIGLVWAKALVVLDRQIDLMWIGLVAFLVNLLGNVGFSQFLGAPGIGLATAFMYGVTAILSWLSVRRVHRKSSMT